MIRPTAAVLALLSAAACGSSSTAPAAPTTAAATQPPAEIAAGEPYRTEVTLIDAGREPRRALRYGLSASSDRTMRMVMDMSMSMEIGPNPAVKVDLPPIQMDMAMRIVERLGDHEVRCTFEVTGVEVLADEDATATAMREHLLTLLKTMVGTKGGMRVDDRGRSRDLTMEAPPGLAPELRSSFENSRRAMDQVAAPLPVEPVGIGARWRAVQRIEYGGMAMTQTVVFRLTSAEGQTIEVESTATQSADPQSIKSPELPAGTVLELVSLSGNLTGKGRIDLAELVPHRSGVSGTSDSAMIVKMNGQETPMKLHVETDIDMSLRD